MTRLWILMFGLAAVAGGEEVAWAGRNPLVDQWKDALARLRADRKPQPIEGCLYSERVEWDRGYDIGGAGLLDQRRLMLAVDEQQGAAIDKWEKGRVLVLCYDEARGATLLDPESGLRLAVRHITAWHPIDGYVASLNAQTTVDRLAANEEAQRLWRLEIDRSVREVLALRHLPEAVRQKFIKLSRARLDYVGQQADFATSAVYATYPGGTLCGPAAGDEIVALYRATYMQLSGLYEYYRSFDTQPSK